MRAENMSVSFGQTRTPTRRQVLQAGLSLAAAPSMAGVVRAAGTNPDVDRTLVLLHLSGGNDGLNTIIPYADPAYYALRPHLSCVARSVLRIDDQVGFHPALSALVPVFEQGNLAIVQGVGYPAPDYSHVGSCRIWSTGRTDATSHLARRDTVLDQLAIQSRTGPVCVGGEAGTMMPTARLVTMSVTGEPADSPSPAANPIAHRPGRVERTLATLARLVSSARPPALVFAAVGGFDTHAGQLEEHGQVLRELGDGLASFQRELKERGAAARVILMAWSEFGRRPAENATGGTDHGSAGPVFLLGKKIRGGLYGQMPSLRDTDFGNLIHTVDFRAVYATIVDRWFNGSADVTIGGRDSLLAFV